MDTAKLSTQHLEQTWANSYAPIRDPADFTELFHGQEKTNKKKKKKNTVPLRYDGPFSPEALSLILVRSLSQGTPGFIYVGGFFLTV